MQCVCAVRSFMASMTADMYSIRRPQDNANLFDPSSSAYNCFRICLFSPKPINHKHQLSYMVLFSVYSDFRWFLDKTEEAQETPKPKTSRNMKHSAKRSIKFFASFWKYINVWLTISRFLVSKFFAKTKLCCRKTISDQLYLLQKSNWLFQATLNTAYKRTGLCQFENFTCHCGVLGRKFVKRLCRKSARLLIHRIVSNWHSI